MGNVACHLFNSWRRDGKVKSTTAGSQIYYPHRWWNVYIVAGNGRERNEWLKSTSFPLCCLLVAFACLPLVFQVAVNGVSLLQESYGVHRDLKASRAHYGSCNMDTAQRAPRNEGIHMARKGRLITTFEPEFQKPPSVDDDSQ
jgi:hypothetical protein